MLTILLCTCKTPNCHLEFLTLLTLNSWCQLFYTASQKAGRAPWLAQQIHVPGKYTGEFSLCWRGSAQRKAPHIDYSDSVCRLGDIKRLRLPTFANPHFGTANLAGHPSFKVMRWRSHISKVSLVWGLVPMYMILAMGAKKLHTQCLSSAVHVPRIVISDHHSSY